MGQRLIGAAIFAAVLTSAMPAPAEGPMSPVRSLSPGPARILPSPGLISDATTQPSAQEVATAVKKPAAEPVAVADLPPSTTITRNDVPASPRDEKGDLPSAVSNPPVPVVADGNNNAEANKPEFNKAEPSKAEPKTVQRRQRSHNTRVAPRRYRAYDTRVAGPSYDRGFYGRPGWIGSSTPYTPGFGPAPYSSSGN